MRTLIANGTGVLKLRTENGGKYFSVARSILRTKATRNSGICGFDAFDFEHRLGDLADLVVEDLRRWQWWDLTDTITKSFDLRTHQSQLVRRAIVRYALSCPGESAKMFVAKVRKSDATLVQEIEEYLREFELTNPTR